MRTGDSQILTVACPAYYPYSSWLSIPQLLEKVVQVSPTVLTPMKNRDVGDESEASGRPLRELTEWEERHRYERNHENEPSSQPTGTHL